MNSDLTTKFLLRPLLAIALYFCFCFGCIIACALAPIAAFFMLSTKIRNGYLGNVVKAVDRLHAALVGRSGRFMLSTECAHAACRTLNYLGLALEIVDKSHCASSAIEEGAYCRISDKQLGLK